jgi:hypothetical protein
MRSLILKLLASKRAGGHKTEMGNQLGRNIADLRINIGSERG